MALHFNTSNCNPPERRDKTEESKHYVICTLCMVAGIGEITEKNKEEVFSRLHAIEEVHGATLVGPDGNVFLTQTDIDRWVGMTLNVAATSKRQWKAQLAKMKARM
jgi:hypothetical protein